MENPFAQALRMRARLHLSRLAFDLRCAARDAIVATVAALLALAATGCAVAALWLQLAPIIGTPAAALSSAAALLVLLVAGGAIFGLRRIIAPRMAAQAPLAAPAAPDIAEAAAQVFGANKMALLLAALVAGAAAAETLRDK